MGDFILWSVRKYTHVYAKIVLIYGWLNCYAASHNNGSTPSLSQSLLQPLPQDMFSGYVFKCIRADIMRDGSRTLALT